MREDLEKLHQSFEAQDWYAENDSAAIRDRLAQYDNIFELLNDNPLATLSNDDLGLLYDLDDFWYDNTGEDAISVCQDEIYPLFDLLESYQWRRDIFNDLSQLASVEISAENTLTEVYEILTLNNVPSLIEAYVLNTDSKIDEDEFTSLSDIDNVVMDRYNRHLCGDSSIFVAKYLHRFCNVSVETLTNPELIDQLDVSWVRQNLASLSKEAQEYAAQNYRFVVSDIDSTQSDLQHVVAKSLSAAQLVDNLASFDDGSLTTKELQRLLDWGFADDDVVKHKNKFNDDAIEELEALIAGDPTRFGIEF